MDLRDTKFENDELQTVAPNIEDVETFFRYLKRLEHDGLDAAVIELPSAWDLNYIDLLRTQIDEFDHSDCHLIAVSFLNDPDSFHQYQNEAKQKGVSLLDGRDLTWETVLTEIKHALTMRNEAVGDSTISLSASELARLAKSTHRIAGIAVADVVSPLSARCRHAWVGPTRSDSSVLRTIPMLPVSSSNFVRFMANSVSVCRSYASLLITSHRTTSLTRLNNRCIKPKQQSTKD